ncbi:MAG: hypothetical protein CL844_06390 [Crocinitomicaceae bacterium]|nr:hypothetical protein [Crocinitomicaceae bacterium]|tara:strand:+ start:31423 stop:36642 length:5220 start_codon:yes stop_codon:yes gene_type:complete
MKLIKKILLQTIFFILLFSFSTFSQRGKDGDLDVSVANTVLNSYTYLTSTSPPGSTTITVESNLMNGGIFNSNLAAGDLIMILQMQGASVDINNFPVLAGGIHTAPSANLYDWWLAMEDFGAITNYKSAGYYQTIEVAGVSGSNTIELQCGLNYIFAHAKNVQVIRIPRLKNLTVSGGYNSIVPSPWDGQSGGVVALEVDSVLTINSGSSISADYAGFRGGELDPSGQSGNPNNPNEIRYLGTPIASEGSEKGEGIFGYHNEYDNIDSRYGIGAAANGGGGGGYQNCGGGGGSNVSSSVTGYTGKGIPNGNVCFDLESPGFSSSVSPGGGRGGYALSYTTQDPVVNGPNLTSWAGDARKTNGGLGGHPLTYDSKRLFFGGGGGAGDQDSNQGGKGGNGGGLVYIQNYGNIIGGGAPGIPFSGITSRGEPGQNTNPNNEQVTFQEPKKGNDGAGGGGAGGAIYIECASPIPSSISLITDGGAGGNQSLTVLPFTSLEAAGPGGGGTGGYISYTSGTPTESSIGGSNGVTTSNQMSAFPANGATSAEDGVLGLSSGYYDLVASDTLFCGTTTTDLSVTTLGTIPNGTTIEWYTQEFGGASVNSGSNYSSVTISATTTYYIGVCGIGAGTFRVPLTVTIVNDNLVITNPNPVCDPSTIDITSPLVTAGSDPGLITYWIDSITTIPFVTPTVADSGTYYIQLDAGFGCVNVQPVLVTVNSLDDPSFTMTPTCDGGTSNVTGSQGGIFFFNNPPNDAAVINPITGTVSNGTSGASYDIIYTTSGVCSTFSTDTLNVLLEDDPTFTMTATCDGGTANVTGTIGGTFSFNTPPNDAAVIDPLTGDVTGGTLGNSYDVLYTTNGPCPSSSIVSVTSVQLNDATFTMTANCDGGIANISGTTGGTFDFAVPPGDTAVIDSITGTVTGGTSGSTYDIIYTTPGGVCSLSSVESITVLITDDPSFVMTPTCDGAVASILGTQGGTFSFDIPPSDTASINSITGEITGGSSNNTYDVLYTTSGICPSFSVQSVISLTTDDPSFTLISGCDGGTANVTGTIGGIFDFDTPPIDAAVIDPISGSVSNGGPGASYLISYTTNGACPAFSIDTLTVLDVDDASFLMTPTCDGGTALVEGLIGGTFSFDTPPIDAAVIDPITGTVTNGTSGASYDIVYVTNGTCPANSDETLIVLITDDASFDMISTCDGGTANVIGVTGGTFSFDTPPSDLAVIDPITGTVTSGTSGASYNILYTTNGTCPASSVDTLTVLITDDASFVLTSTCDGGTANITGVIGGTFSFAIPPIDAAIIDPITGTVSGGTFGNTYDILYTTSGICPGDSVQSLTALNQDDPTFTMTPNCDGGIANVIGTTGGIFAFAVPPIDAAVIDPISGIVSGGSFGASYDIIYTTNGTCPDSLTENLTVLTVDDPSFIMTANCDGGIANISGTIGGTFSFAIPPGDGAIIDPITGTVTNVTNGNTYNILYTTNGACTADSISSFTALDADDASFSFVSGCSGGTALISGTTGGIFTFLNSPSDSAILDSITGTVTNGTSGASYDVIYTTNGSCPDTSTQTLNILITDDPSFMMTPTCDGANASILGTQGGTFTFNNVPSDTASIDPSTGNVTGGSPSVTYQVLYITNGTCPASSIETFTSDDCTVLVIPTAFTPDNDGDNDTWEILELDFKYPNNKVKVFNRWGDIIFQHNSSALQPYNSNRWDGTYKGNLLPVGSYYFIIDFNDGSSDRRTGTISIILL